MRARLVADARLWTALWLVVLGSLLVAFVLCWAALLEMNRTYPPAIRVPERGTVTFEPVR